MIEREIQRPTFVAWYRNPMRANPAALRIAYQTEAGTWASLQLTSWLSPAVPTGSFGASIVDPHGDHLADARVKLTLWLATPKNTATSTFVSRHSRRTATRTW